MTMLDKIPDSTWFFCFPLSFGVICITLLGIIHPLFWISVMRIYRSEVFVFMYVLVGFWSFLSCALLYAIFAVGIYSFAVDISTHSRSESSCIYVFWIWYTMAFGATMAGMMFLLFCGFCVLGMRRKSVCALLGLIYYLVTLYFVVVVNKQRKEVFGLQSHDCGECAERSGSPRFHELQDIPDKLPNATNATTPTQPTAPMKTTTLTTTIMTTMTMSASPTVRAIDDAMRTVAMAALLAADFTEDEVKEHGPKTTHSWVMDPVQRVVTPELPKTLPSPESDRMAAMARLSELLLNSNECRKPRKPAHGRFEVTGRSTGPRGSTLRLTLHCDNGYKENSVVTQCKYNWWDRPIPQCRKRREPAPLPAPGIGCIMPDYPAHGEYRVADHARARPGERVVGDNVILLVTCDEPYRAVDPYVICVEGRWRHAPPSCQKHCKLVFDPTVEYKCFKAFKDEFLACGAWQPDRAIVAAACRPGHAHRGPFRYMRCRGDAWDHVVSCLPNSNFTKDCR